MAAATTVPQKMKALRLNALIEPAEAVTAKQLEGKMELVEVDVPEPKEGEVLIQVHSAAINPADLMKLSAVYGAPPKTAEELAAKRAIPEGGLRVGGEGAGVVVKGPDALVGKRVAFLGSPEGAWTQYATMPAARVAPIGEAPFEQAAGLFVNPITVLSFLEWCKENDHKALVHTAAASSLGRMLIRHAKREGIRVICVVRKDEQVKTCIATGAEEADVFNTSVDGWEDKLRARAAEVGAKVAFDAVAGALTEKVLGALPQGSQIRVYGGLGGFSASNNIAQLIFEEKTVTGHWLETDFRTRDPAVMGAWIGRVVTHLGDDFAAPIAATFPLSEYAKAFDSYASNASAGKVVFTPASE